MSYYYGGSSSGSSSAYQLYSPYYTPGLYSTSSTSSSGAYAPYASAYNRAYSGSYIVPISPTRTSNFSSHALSSRYQPKLSTITETSALINAARHPGLIPLTRTHSPKFSPYTGATSSAKSLPSTTKYIPPRPIPINTADIDVSSSSRYRKHFQNQNIESRRSTPTTSPTTSVKRPSRGENSQNSRSDNAAVKKQSADPAPNHNTTETTEHARSTIKRNRPVVRLSTIRSRSKDRSKSSSSGIEVSPEPAAEIKSKDDANSTIAIEESISWRQKLANELAGTPNVSSKKTPGDLIRERYLIQEKGDARGKNELNIPQKLLVEEQVVIEVDPLHQTIRRLSIPQCPSFHEICADISSDKIDDDLNAGELRRRASVIQEQEMEIMNQLQRSTSGSFQLIHLERQEYPEADDDSTRKSITNKRKSGKKIVPKKIRHKITATVEIENPPLTPILQEPIEEESGGGLLSPKSPKLICNVETVEEHHQIHKIFKLPKKKTASVKKVNNSTKIKAEEETSANVTPVNDKKITTPQIFTFDAVKYETEENIFTPASPKFPVQTITKAKRADITTVEAKNVEKNKISPEAKSEEGTATPKPIKKTFIQKSDSGEDFWSQIGTRETLYMSNRKKAAIENRSDQGESSQQNESLKTDEERSETKTKSNEKTSSVRSQSNELSLKITETDTKSNHGKFLAKEDDKLNAMKKEIIPSRQSKSSLPQSKIKSPEVQAKSKTKPSSLVQSDLLSSTSSKNTSGLNVEQIKTPSNVSKSCDPTKQTDQKVNNNKISSPLPSSSAATQSPASPLISGPLPSPTSANLRSNQTSVTQPEVKRTDAKIPTTAVVTEQGKNNLHSISNEANLVALPKVSPTEIKALATVMVPTPTTTLCTTTAKTTPPTTVKAVIADISADRLAVSIASSPSPSQPIASQSSTDSTSPVIVTMTTNVDKTADKFTTAATTIDNTITIPNSSPPPLSTSKKEPPQRADSNSNSETPLSPSSGKNLSKFATVSNLAQCLQDVDADLEDYIPSSEEDSSSAGSSYDSSSENGSTANLSASMKKKDKQRRKKEKAAAAEQNRFDPNKKIKIDTKLKCYVKEEAPRYPLVATPRPLWKREKVIYDDDSDDGSDSEETETDSECSTSEDYEDELNPSRSSLSSAASPASKESAIIRMSTCSNDSGFEGGTAPSSPKKMLDCDVNCHKKCEKLTANLCGVNQKLIVEALACVRRGTQEARDSPSTPLSLNPAYKIDTNEEQDETSYTYSQFQKSGRITAPATTIPRFKKYSVEDFHFLAVLGKGSFGKVLLAELRNTDFYYAVKCLKKDVVLEDDDVECTLIERKVLALGTKHPYLCHLFCTFQTESHLFFVMEYLNGGDLMFHIQESGRFSEERARFYGAEIISGLKFLHKKGIIYRDLKLDNVLLDFDGHVRIADFGMCKLQIYLDKTADSFCGTPDYMAPEIIKGDKYNQNVDWWSFGVLLYEMLIGQSPFSGCDEDELFWSICNELPWFPVYISQEATSILKGLLEKDSSKRIGSHYSPAGDISDHIFFKDIDWGLLDKRLLDPPFKPQVKHPLDTQYFDRAFTRERVRLTPIDKEILQSMDQEQFTGFSYTNPNATLD